MLLGRSPYVELVGGGAVQFRIAVCPGIRGEDRLALGDAQPVDLDVLGGEAQREVRHRRLVAQRLLDQIRPGRAPLGHLGALILVGQQREDGLIEQVHRGLVPGADHQQQRVDQFLLGQL
ncbi:hypothetical protein IFM12275_22760 [Nocardia sputorum]|nr:hypothetical protein IFM12275_22760 [Nocardia sputorum]